MNKLSLVSAVALCAGMLFGSTTPEGWTDDYDAALKRAKAENKLVLADFSGSDWCYWCKRLDSEVFATDTFKKAAAEKYVLLLIDSPRDKSGLSEKARANNKKLAKKYNVSGYPTVILMNAAGEVVAETGYKDGGPDKYLAHLETIAREGLAKLAAAPAEDKYLKPIESILNAPDENMKREMEALQVKLDEKLPRPAKSATQEEKDSYKRKVNVLGAVLMVEVIEKYIPIYEKAFAEAKATQVPAEFEAKKNELISGQEQTLDAMKKMRDMMKGQLPAELLDAGSGL